MTDPDENNSQNKRDQETYQVWEKVDFIAWGILASCINNDLLYEYKQYLTAYALWNILKKKFGCTSLTKPK